MPIRWITFVILGTCLLSAAGVLGCGGGCSGGPQPSVPELLEKLPATVDGVVVIDVRRTINRERIESLAEQTGGTRLRAQIPPWVHSVTHIAIVSDWAMSEDETSAPDCERAASHGMELMKRKAGTDPDLLAAVRTGLLERCQQGPQIATCLMKAAKFEEMEDCYKASSSFAVILVGDFEVSDVIGVFSQALSGGSQGGLDLVVEEHALTGLADGVVVAGDIAMVKTVKAAWRGEAKRLGADSKVTKLLNRIDRRAATIAVGRALTTLWKRSPTNQAAMSVTFDGKSDLKFWMKADEAMLTEVEAGLSKLRVDLAKSTQNPDGFAAFIDERETVKLFRKAAEGFLKSVESRRTEDGMLITATMNLDIEEYWEVATPLGKAYFYEKMRSAKTAEAIEGVERIYKGAAAYFMTPRASTKDGSILPCRFPKSVACTPSAKPCSMGRKYPAADASTWSDPTWAALAFKQVAGHYYQYCFESNGSGANADFTVTAHGDLDCDGIVSTFRRSGAGVVADDGACSVESVGGLLRENALE